MSNYKVTVLGAGLAGCEAALWLAGKGVQVELYEQKPAHFSPAHKSEGFAELICSNSLKAERLDSASGLLKEEMRRMGSQLLNAAEAARVAAGGALAVDRDTFRQLREAGFRGFLMGETFMKTPSPEKACRTFFKLLPYDCQSVRHEGGGEHPSGGANRGRLDGIH